MADSPISLAGRSAIVTGGGRGLGRAMVEALAAAGASVLAVDLDAEPLSELMAKVRGDVAVQRADVTDEADARAAVDACVDAFGRVDMVVNNAGIGMSSLPGGHDPTFDAIDDATMRRFFDVHVLGSLHCAKAAIDRFRAQGSGRIVAVTTSLWFMLAGKNVPYGPAKAAMEALASAMYRDLEGTGITVNVVVPGGGADTRFVPTGPGETRDHLIKPAVMGPPVVFLASAGADGVNGRRIIAKDWDVSLAPEDALARSSTPIGWPGSH